MKNIYEISIQTASSDYCATMELRVQANAKLGDKHARVIIDPELHDDLVRHIRWYIADKIGDKTASKTATTTTKEN